MQKSVCNEKSEPINWDADKATTLLRTRQEVPSKLLVDIF